MAIEVRVKDPLDKLDYVINWRGTAGLAAEETITSSTWAVYDNQWVTTTALTVHPELEAHDDETATGWVSGGVKGKSYYFTNHIVTNEGRELSCSILIRIREQ